MRAGFAECKEHGGHHIHADHIFVETIDPDTWLHVPKGEFGELVFTHLSRKSMPLIRYRQGDITKIEKEKCICGRTTPRIMSIIGRVDNMIKIKGVSVYPEQIEEALLGITGIVAYLIEAYTDPLGIDRIKIKAAYEGEQQDQIYKEIQVAIKSKTKISPDIIETISKEEAIRIWFSRGTRKPKKFWDKRERVDT
jgi:phenylacetate-CoA ligase